MPRTRGTAGIGKQLETIIRQQAKRQAKQIVKNKNYVHIYSLLRHFLSPDFLALLTIQNFDFVVKARKIHPTLKANHLFVLQYLYKVDFASSHEIRYFLKQTFKEVPKHTSFRGLYKYGLLERYEVFKGKDNTKHIAYVITKKGRGLVEQLANYDMLKNMFNNYKEVNKLSQKKTYGKRKAWIERNRDNAGHLSQR